MSLEKLYENLRKRSSVKEIRTIEMHTGGEPLRIIPNGLPVQEMSGETTILQKRTWMMENNDEIRKLLIYEPRGHFDMYAAVLVTPDLPEADLAALFLHNEGYSTMCGHAVVALGRYAVDTGLVAGIEPETPVNIQCPCGLVRCHVTVKDGLSSDVRFTSVPSFVFALDVSVDVEGVGQVTVDVVYGGAFYALLPAAALGLDPKRDSIQLIRDTAYKVTEAVKSKVQVVHPESRDLSFLYGTIVTESPADQHAFNICVFAEKEVDRSPCGSGVTARVAAMYRRGKLGLNTSRHFRSGVTGSEFVARAVEVCKIGEFDAVRVEVSGRASYTGSSSFIAEPEDQFLSFLPK